MEPNTNSTGWNLRKYASKIGGNMALSQFNPLLGAASSSGLLSRLMNRNKPAPAPMTPAAPITPTAPQPMAPVAPAPTMTTSSNLYPAGVTREALAHTASVIANAKMQPKNNSTFDVDKYFENVDTMDPSITDLYATRNAINNRRNDIATGKVDPYDLAKKYGVVFSPGDQSSINKAIAEVYDPMLEDVNARIQHKMDVEKQSASGSGGWQGGVLSGLSNTQANAVWNRLGELYYDNPTVKEYESSARAYNNIMSVDPQTANSSQKQALISDFAKYLDPDSVVREAEFEITQKYGQSGIAKINNSIKQWVNGTGVLTPEAAEAIQIAAAKRFESTNGYLNKKRDEVVRVLNNSYGPRDYMQLLVDSAPVGYGGNTSNQGISPEERQQLLQMGYSEEEINSLGGQSFNSVGGGTNQAITSLDDALSRISRNESSGNYQALGPVVSKGQYKGERALGKYQVMPGNLPQWSRLAIGRVVTPQEFLASPQLQEAIVRDQFQRNYQKYGNWNDVASVWFTGQPVTSRSLAARDDLGTSGADYIRKFNS